MFEKIMKIAAVFVAGMVTGGMIVDITYLGAFIAGILFLMLINALQEKISEYSVSIRSIEE